MRYQEIITEKSNSAPLIAVDIQPAYSLWFNFENEFSQFLASRTGPVLMLVNAEEHGVSDDSMDTIISWYHELFEENGLEFRPENYTWFDKGFGHLRAWMDQGVPEGAIIDTIREMYNQKVNDSRDLFNGNSEELENFLGEAGSYLDLDDPLTVEWISVSLLRKFGNGLICGGGKHECLKEVQLLMNAFNIKYREVSKFIY